MSLLVNIAEECWAVKSPSDLIMDKTTKYKVGLSLNLYLSTQLTNLIIPIAMVISPDPKTVRAFERAQRELQGVTPASIKISGANNNTMLNNIQI